MSATVSVQHTGSSCVVSGTLDFTTAREALNRVESVIHDCGELDINLAGVSECNSAGLALLIEWLAIARRSGHTVTFSDIPTSLRQLAGVCQVDGLI